MADDKSVLAIFVDVRGYTRWAEANEVFINLDRFVSGFMAILARRFVAPDFLIKPLGDGALLMHDLPDSLSRRDITALIGRTVAAIGRVDQDFQKHCRDFGKSVGHASELRLGWGVVRGKVIRVGPDWTGHNLNKCSRLCGLARPFGIVIDRDDFPELPREVRGLTAQVRRLAGIGEVAVWVTAEIASQFIPRERIRETPEVHVAGTCFMEEGPGRVKLLVARRSMERRLFPGKLEGCGGQLKYSETFVEGVRRHFRQELGIDVEVLDQCHVFYEIREPDEPVIPGIRFLCKRVGTTEPSSTNHSELRWVTEAEFRNISAHEFVGNLKHEVIELLGRYRRS